MAARPAPRIGIFGGPGTRILLSSWVLQTPKDSCTTSDTELLTRTAITRLSPHARLQIRLPTNAFLGSTNAQGRVFRSWGRYKVVADKASHVCPVLSVMQPFRWVRCMPQASGKREACGQSIHTCQNGLEASGAQPAQRVAVSSICCLRGRKAEAFSAKELTQLLASYARPSSAGKQASDRTVRSLKQTNLNSAIKSGRSDLEGNQLQLSHLIKKRGIVLFDVFFLLCTLAPPGSRCGALPRSCWRRRR